MESETQGAFIREMAGVVKKLAVRTQKQQGTAEEAIGKLQDAASVLDAAAISCSELSVAVSKNIDETIKSAMSGAGAGAADIIVERFETASHRATEAAKRYENAGKSIGWRVAGTISLACLILLGASVYLIQGSSIYLAEIHALREEKAQLQAAISSLESRGARSIGMCHVAQNRELPCAYVLLDPRKQEGKWALISTPK